MSALRRAAVSESWARSLMPATSHGSETGTASTSEPASRSSPMTSVRYFSPCALSVVRLASWSRSALAPNDVDAGVDLVDRALVVGGVLLLDDAVERAVGAAHDAAVAGGVVVRSPRARMPARRRRGAASRKAASVSASSSGTSPFSTSTSPVEVVGERRDGLLDRTAGAGDLVLVDDDRARQLGLDGGGDLIALVAHDRDDVRGVERLRRREHVADDRRRPRAGAGASGWRTSCACPGRRRAR